MAVSITEKLNFDDLPLRSRHSFDYIVTRDQQNAEVAIPIEIIVGRKRRPRLVAIAGVHGNEIDGITALQDMSQEIKAGELDGMLVIVPTANPPAVLGSMRHGPDDNLDMNRIFPGDPSGSTTQRIAYHLFHNLVLGADLLATFHGWTNDGMVIPYTEFADGIGQVDVENASYQASLAFGFGIHRVTPDKPGRLLPEATKAGIPTIESEIVGLGKGDRQNSQSYKQGLINLLIHMHMLPGKLNLPEKQLIVRSREIQAPGSGLIRYDVELNTWVDKSMPLAHIFDLHGNQLTLIAAHTKALVATQRWWPYVTTGQLVSVLFEEIPNYQGPQGLIISSP